MTAEFKLDAYVLLIECYDKFLSEQNHQSNSFLQACVHEVCVSLWRCVGGEGWAEERNVWRARSFTTYLRVGLASLVKILIIVRSN